jgi:protease I
MGKVLMIIAQDGFRDEELIVPKEVLEKEGHSVKIASLSRGKSHGSRGAVVAPDLAVYEANPEFFDAVIVVGGPGSRKLSEDRSVLNLVIEAAARKKIVGAICLGPMTLAKAGVLAGRNATVFPDREGVSSLRQNAANYVREPVVVDGLIVTADGPLSAGSFGAAVSALLKGKTF